MCNYPAHPNSTLPSTTSFFLASCSSIPVTPTVLTGLVLRYPTLKLYNNSSSAASPFIPPFPFHHPHSPTIPSEWKNDCGAKPLGREAVLKQPPSPWAQHPSRKA